MNIYFNMISTVETQILYFFQILYIHIMKQIKWKTKKMGKKDVSSIFACQQIRISIILHNDCIVFHLWMFCTFCKQFLLHISIVSVSFSPTLYWVLSPITLLRIYFGYRPCKNPKLFSNLHLTATFLWS